MQDWRARLLTPKNLVVAASILAYVVLFAPLRSLTGEAVGALSAIPILLTGRYFTRRETWLVAACMAVLNGILFSAVQVGAPSAEWQGALLGTVSLFITADLVGRAREATLRLQRSGEYKDEFLAGVSHELRTPLTAVVGYSALLDGSWRDMEEEELEMIIGLIHQQSSEVSHIVEDLLVATRLRNESLTFTRDAVHMRAEVDAVISSLPPPEGTRVSVSGSSDAHVFGDAVRIRQILRNLISNAYRYGGPRIDVSVVESPSTVVVSVADNGGGLPEEEWETIFASYYRSHRRAGQPDSVGLGLTVSRSLARAMGGELTYGWAPERSTFSLQLPAAARSPLLREPAGAGEGRG